MTKQAERYNVHACIGLVKAALYQAALNMHGRKAEVVVSTFEWLQTGGEEWADLVGIVGLKTLKASLKRYLIPVLASQLLSEQRDDDPAQTFGERLAAMVRPRQYTEMLTNVDICKHAASSKMLRNVEICKGTASPEMMSNDVISKMLAFWKMLANVSV